MEPGCDIPLQENDLESKPKPRIICGPGIHLVLLGNTAVGKTSIAYRFLQGEVLKSPRPTIGGDLIKKSVQLLGNKEAAFYIFDTSDFPGIFSKVGCRSSQAAVLVYDISNAEMKGGRKLPHRFCFGPGIHLALLGNSAVGKTSIAYYFRFGKVMNGSKMTIGIDFLKKPVRLFDGRTATFFILDTADHHDQLSNMCCKSSQAAVVVYDISNAKSLDNAKTWIRDLKTYADENVIIVLAGNKSDLADEPHLLRQVETEDARAYAEENGFLFTEVSARTGMGIQAMFMVIAEEMMSRGWCPEENRGIVLTNGNGKTRKKAIFKRCL